MPATSGRYDGPSDLVRRQEQCNTVDSIVNAISSGSPVVVYTTSGGVTAYSVCQLMANRGRMGLGEADCGHFAAILASAIATIYTAVQQSKTGTVDTSPQSRRRLLTRLDPKASSIGLADLFADDLKAQGTEFEGIEHLSLTPTGHSKRAVDEAELQIIEHIRIYGVKAGGITHDLTIADFGGGKGHVFVQPVENTGNMTLGKRHNGPGFKVTYSYDGRTKLDKMSQSLIAQSVAGDWQYRANKHGIGNYIGYIASNPFNYYVDL